MAEIYLKEEGYRIVGACFEVYNVQGAGFLESVYQECLAIEFGLQEIPFIAQQELKLNYKGQSLKSAYVPDFVCFNSVIVEIKATSELTGQHEAQVHNYLKATGFKLGLLVNFGQHPDLKYMRILR